ncbi:hypothetical protein C6502_04295 [Candidatus Poribacteria bacterium]|nr:MAG: hypothetical protein C6502_04295 [Candidatus Poribacteria bacterium]
MRTQLFRLTFFLLICVSIPLTTQAQIVNIPDSNLRAVIASALGKVSGDPITDVNGRAQSTLTLGQNLRVHVVSATAAGWVIDDPAIFSVISDTEPPPITTDVNGDGIANILDLVLVASAFGSEGPDLPTDVNGDRVVNILDLVWVADALGAAPAAPSLHPQVLEMLTAEDVKLWLSHAQQLDLTDPTALKGILFLEQLLDALLPRETALLPNYPNPFNPETWIPYRLAEAAPVTLTIYDSNGQVVRTLDLGYQIEGFYETRSKAIHWNGRNEFDEQVASGVYFYHLSAGDYSATRKMLILNKRGTLSRYTTPRRCLHADLSGRGSLEKLDLSRFLGDFTILSRKEFSNEKYGNQSKVYSVNANHCFLDLLDTRC